MLELIKEKGFANGKVYALKTYNGYPVEVTDTFLPYYTKDAIGRKTNTLTGKELGSRSDRWMIGVSCMSGCKIGCRFCFVPGTLVHTAIGRIPINLLQQDDDIIGYNNTNKRIRLQEIQEIFKRQYKGKLIKIELESGEIIKVTPNHRFFLKDGSEKSAENLTENDELLDF